MTPQQHKWLTGPFERLKPVSAIPKTSTDEFIAQAGAAQPSVPCFTAQLSLMRDQG